MIHSHFDKLSFHDASIEKIVRADGSIVIEFKGAFLSSEHPESNGSNWVIEEGVLTLTGVTSEKTLFWYDDKEGKAHPSPDLPLDEIMELKYSDSMFSFAGFLDKEPWAEWFVGATGFNISITAKSIPSS